MAQSDNCVFYKENGAACVSVYGFLAIGASNSEIYFVKNALE
jgi:hypothetical protein